MLPILSARERERVLLTQKLGRHCININEIFYFLFFRHNKNYKKTRSQGSECGISHISHLLVDMRQLTRSIKHVDHVTHKVSISQISSLIKVNINVYHLKYLINVYLGWYLIKLKIEK